MKRTAQSGSLPTPGQTQTPRTRSVTAGELERDRAAARATTSERQRASRAGVAELRRKK